MESSESILARWTALYEQLNDARLHLKSAMERPEPVPPQLKARVRECERLCRAALYELNAACDKDKSAPA